MDHFQESTMLRGVLMIFAPAKLKRGLLVALMGLLPAFSVADDSRSPPVKDLVNDAQKRAAERLRSLDLKVKEYGNKERVKELASKAKKEAQARFDALAKDDGHMIEKGVDAETGRPKRGVLVVALSSSMPESVLRQYMNQLSGAPEATVILKGFVGGASEVVPTGKWIEKIRRVHSENGEGPHYNVKVVVDPLAYRDLNIEMVPAFAWLPDVQDLRHCDAEVLRASTVVYGEVSVEAALKQLNKEGVKVPSNVIKGS